MAPLRLGSLSLFISCCADEEEEEEEKEEEDDEGNGYWDE